MGKLLTGQERDKFKGVFSLLLTPFQTNGTIDWKAYDKYVGWQLSSSPQGLFAVCGSSEMKWLLPEERWALARRAVALAGEVPVVATANVDEDPAAHAEELKRMEETGVSGLVLVPPPGGAGPYADPQARFEYYAELAAAASLPVFIYEWPQRENYLIDSELYGRLARETGINGIKDTTCTIEGITSKIKAAPESIVYQANMVFMLDAIEAGAGGIESIHSAAASALVVNLWQAATTGDTQRAEKLHEQLVFLDALLGASYPATAKYLAGLQGQSMGLTCRAPGQSLKREHQKAMELFHERCIRRFEAESKV